jgi:hypothetical protein
MPLRHAILGNFNGNLSHDCRFYHVGAQSLFDLKCIPPEERLGTGE